MSYDLAIFDFDGTLADTVTWFAGIVNHVADRYGFRRVEEREHEVLRGYEPRRLLKVLAVPVWKVPLIAYHLRTLVARDIDQISLFDGVDALLHTLSRADVRLAVVSSNSHENVHRILGPDNVALIETFSCGVSIFGKAAKLRAVLGRCDVMPSEAIYIGDEIRDIEAAQAAGMASGAVSWGYNTVESLKACAPNEIFTSIDDIPQRIIRGQESGGRRSAVHQR
jgi:phosphoglycolate phosphatase